MLLRDLIKEIGQESPFGDAEIVCVTDQFENVVPGSLYVAVEGKRRDGHTLVRQALENGAVAAVTGRSVGCGREIVVRDPRTAYSCLCAAFYGHPDRALSVIGVTGTNGKTSTAVYLKTILERAGCPCGLIGTLGCGVGEDLTDSGYTTPESDTFFASLRGMADAGCRYCAAEVSSQALSQARVDAARFTLGVLTNIGTDHLDYHGKMSEYVAAKSRLFRLSGKALLNADDAYCEQIATQAGLASYLTYSVKGNFADYMVKNRRISRTGQQFSLIHGGRAVMMTLPPVCDFTVYNVLAAAAAAHTVGVPLAEAASFLRELPPVKGRMQRIGKSGVTVYIDFAHTPEALAGVLKGLCRLKRGRLILVFGCGGDRDKSKRPAMGRIACAYADSVIVTSDNPRTEDPDAIIAQIAAGAPGKNNVFIQPDREKAIALAINQASPGDTVLIAGKGHEEYQIFSDKKVYFSDAAVVKKLLGE